MSFPEAKLFILDIPPPKTCLHSVEQEYQYLIEKIKRTCASHAIKTLRGNGHPTYNSFESKYTIPMGC